MKLTDATTTSTIHSLDTSDTTLERNLPKKNYKRTGRNHYDKTRHTTAKQNSFSKNSHQHEIITQNRNNKSHHKKTYSRSKLDVISSRSNKIQTRKETSAGGLIIRSLGSPFEELEVALIGRLDRRGRLLWSIPKGHIEIGETAEIAAKREIKEETGLSGNVIGQLGEINYSFSVDSCRIKKTVHHFILVLSSGELSSEDPEVSEVAWVKLADLTSRLTYSDERKLFIQAKKFLSSIDTSLENIHDLIKKSNRIEPNSYEKTAAQRNQNRIEYQPIKRATMGNSAKNYKRSATMDINKKDSYENPQKDNQ